MEYSRTSLPSTSPYLFSPKSHMVKQDTRHRTQDTGHGSYIGLVPQVVVSNHNIGSAAKPDVFFSVGPLTLPAQF